MAEQTPAAPSAPPSAPAPPEERKSPVEPLWRFLSSVHVAVVILIILATISIIGTVLQQGPESREDNIRLFEALVVKIYGATGVVDQARPATVEAAQDRIRAAAERLLGFAEGAGFTEIYHTWYFFLLLGTLSASLIVCSLRRWPQTWQVMTRPRLELEEAGFKGSQFRRAVRLRIPRAAAVEAVAAELKKGGYAPRRSGREDADFLFGQKGTFSRLGIYVTHSSIIVIFIGGILGNIFGFKGYMQITEGTSEREVMLRGGMGKKRVLPFEVRCDDFTLVTYPGSGRPKAYYSDLEIIKDGRVAAKQRIEVNGPLAFDGIYFYQSSYGETGEGMKINVTLRDPASGREQQAQFEGTDPRSFPDMRVVLQVVQVVPDFAMDDKRGVYSRSNQPRNPAILVRVTLPDGQQRSTWLFALRPDIKMVRDLPVDLVFNGFESRQYTGLQVVYDPGVWVIWVGCTLMVLGLYLAFFVSHRRVWARVREEEGATVVTLAGNANKNRESFGEQFQKLGDGIEGAARG